MIIDLFFRFLVKISSNRRKADNVTDITIILGYKKGHKIKAINYLKILNHQEVFKIVNTFLLQHLDFKSGYKANRIDSINR